MKKNSYQDFKAKFMLETVYFLVGIIIFAVVGLISFNIYGELNTEIQNSTDMGNTSKLNSATAYARYDDTIDGTVLFITVFMFIAILGIAWFSYENPLFIIILIVLIIVAAIFSNVWQEFATEDDLSTYATNLPMTTHILDNFVIYILSLIAGCGILLFVRSKV
jgi:hypothetical protein